MSKGSTPIKVLRTALKRVQKGWTKGTWMERDKDGGVFVCLEGALFGYCDSEQHNLTPAQKHARSVVEKIIDERYPQFRRWAHNIPSFNDAPERVFEEVEEVVKLAIIREETGGSDDDPEISEEEFDELLDFMDSKG